MSEGLSRLLLAASNTSGYLPSLYATDVSSIFSIFLIRNNISSNSVLQSSHLAGISFREHKIICTLSVRGSILSLSTNMTSLTSFGDIWLKLKSVTAMANTGASS